MATQSLYSKEVMKYFKHPKNVGVIKDADGIGRVGNFQCVIPSVNVYSNPFLIPIQDIKNKQLVFSHDGKFNTVSRTFSRNYSGSIIMIKNRLGNVSVTPEHLFFAIKVPKTDYYMRTKNKKTLPVGWYHAEELERGDILVYPIVMKEENLEKKSIDIKKYRYDFRSKPLPKYVEVDKDFLRLIGYFLAEGSSTTKITSSAISFALNVNEEDIASDIIRLIKRIFNLDAKIVKDVKTNSMSVQVYSAILARWFSQLFSRGAENKQLPHQFMLLPLEKQRHIIFGLWKGDGCVNVVRNGYRAGYSTTSYQLIQQLKILLLRQGIICSIYTEQEKTVKNVHHQKSYRIHIGDKNSLEKLCKILGIKFKSNKREQKKSWIEDGYLFNPITKIEKVFYRGPVHNMEVKGSRSFVTDCSTLHNCGDIMELYIKVKKFKRKEIISDAKFQTFGCVIALAVSSMLTEIVKGKTIEEALKITNKDILKKSGPVPPIKIHCSFLAADALKEAIYNYLSKSKKLVPEELQKNHDRIVNTLKQVEKTHKEFTKFEEKILEK